MDIRNKIDKEIDRQLDKISTMEVGSDSMTNSIKTLTELHKLRMDETKSEESVKMEVEKLNVEKEKVKLERKTSRTNTIVSVLGTVATVGMFAVRLANDNVWLARGFKFEESGIYTSKVFDGIWKTVFRHK